MVQRFFVPSRAGTTADVSGFRTRIVIVEGEQADHMTTTTDFNFGFLILFKICIERSVRIVLTDQIPACHG